MDLKKASCVTLRLVSKLLGLALAGLLGEHHGVGVGKETAGGDSDLAEQLAELLAVADGELQVAGHTASLLVVASCVAGELEAGYSAARYSITVARYDHEVVTEDQGVGATTADLLREAGAPMELLDTEALATIEAESDASADSDLEAAEEDEPADSVPPTADSRYGRPRRAYNYSNVAKGK